MNFGFMLLVLIGGAICQILGGWNAVDADSIPEDVINAAKDKLASENVAFTNFNVVKAQEQVPYNTQDPFRYIIKGC